MWIGRLVCRIDSKFSFGFIVRMLQHHSFESQAELTLWNLVYVSGEVVSISGMVGCVSMWMEGIPIPVGQFINTTYKHIGVRDTVFQSPSVCGLPWGGVRRMSLHFLSETWLRSCLDFLRACWFSYVFFEYGVLFAHLQPSFGLFFHLSSVRLAR